MSRAMSVKTAAAEKELSESTIRAEIDALRLPAYKVGRAIRIDEADLDEWFRSLKRVGSEDDR